MTLVERREPVHPRADDLWRRQDIGVYGMQLVVDSSLCFVLHTDNGSYTIGDTEALINALRAARSAREDIEVCMAGHEGCSEVCGVHLHRCGRCGFESGPEVHTPDCPGCAERRRADDLIRRTT